MWEPPPASWEQTVRYGLLCLRSVSEQEITTWEPNTYTNMFRSTRSDVISHWHVAALKIHHAIHVKVRWLNELCTLGTTPREGRNAPSPRVGLPPVYLFNTLAGVWQGKLLFRLPSQSLLLSLHSSAAAVWNTARHVCTVNTDSASINF